MYSSHDLFNLPAWPDNEGTDFCCGVGRISTTSDGRMIKNDNENDDTQVA
jgi:hypothetical protein